MTVLLRPEDAGDDEFLLGLLAETIAMELGAEQWPESLRVQIVGMQVGNRRMGPRAGYPQGQSSVIVADGERAGWIFKASLPGEVHIVEVMIRPALRGRGVGAAAIGQVLERARQDGRRVTLTVNVLNSGAIRLYERLGFRRVGGTPLQHHMEWT
ncbi:MAG: GNAT family N-acetyltransferase [Candidatus Solibacter sp.]